MAADHVARPLLSGPGEKVHGSSGDGRVAEAEFTADSYAVCTGHHRSHDDDVLSPVAWRPGTRVLDLGCGAGDLTSRLADLVAPGEVLGVDASASLIEHARTVAGRPGLRFEVCRAQELDTSVPAGWADVVVSVAVLHWVPESDQAGVLSQVARALAPGGVFRLDMGGQGQIAATRAVLDDVAAAHGITPSSWFFPDEATAADLLTGAGLDVSWVRLVRQRRRLADADAVERSLRSQVLPGYGRQQQIDSSVRSGFETFAAAAVRRCVETLRRADGSYDQDYVRLDALAVRTRLARSAVVDEGQRES